MCAASRLSGLQRMLNIALTGRVIPEFLGPPKAKQAVLFQLRHVLHLERTPCREGNDPLSKRGSAELKLLGGACIGFFRQVAPSAFKGPRQLVQLPRAGPSRRPLPITLGLILPH
jgi:hypothetical protein